MKSLDIRSGARDFDLPAMPLSYHYEILYNVVAPAITSLESGTLHGRRVFGFRISAFGIIALA